MTTGRILRIGAAVAILISGIIHLDLYFNKQYSFAGDMPNFGRSIALNAIASGIIAAALVARKEWFVRAAGIALSVGTIAIFAYTHSSHTFLGFSASGFDPSPQAQLALLVQIAAIAMIAASFIPAIDTKDASLELPALGVAGAVAAIALIGLTLHWKPESTNTVAAPPTSGVDTATTVAGSTATTVAGATTVPGETATTVAGGAAPAAGAGAVDIKSFAFAPQTLAVAKGTTVTWTNDDGVGHSVVSNDKSFKSEKLNKGDTFQQKFDTDGTFAYICGIHPYMTGTITVTG